MKISTLAFVIVIVGVLVTAAYVENTYVSGTLKNKSSTVQPTNTQTPVSYSAEILNNTLAASTSEAAETITLKNTGTVSIENITSKLYNGTHLLETITYVGNVSAGEVAVFTTGPSIILYPGQQYASFTRVYFVNGAHQSFNQSLTLMELGPVSDSLTVKNDQITLNSGSSVATWTVTFYNSGSDEIMYSQAHLTAGGQTYTIDIINLKPGQSYTGKLSNISSLISGQNVYINFYTIYLDGNTSNLLQKVTV
ncbi:MAG: hypothetical protein ACP5LF_06550 [Nitrososphaeria archaeon]